MSVPPDASSRIPTAPTPEHHLRRPTVDDAAAMWSIARTAVDENSPYAYLMMCEYFAETCSVAECDGRIIGFVTGFRPPTDPRTQFIWQIAVAPEGRGSGLATQLLAHAVAGGRRRASWLEATVTPDNEASTRLFRRFAERNGATCDESLAFDASQFPDGTDHAAEMRFRIGPLTAA